MPAIPTGKSVPKKGLVIAKKGATSNTVKKKATKQRNKPKKLDSNYEDSDASADGDHASLASNGSNDVDMDLIRAAFASAKSKHTKKQDAEFLRQQKELVESAREQAEAVKASGDAQINRLIEQFESLCEDPDNDMRPLADLVGVRTDAANKLYRTSTSTLEQVAADYEEIIQAAAEEFQSRATCRENIRRQTVQHVHRIHERGKEERKLITDATEIINNFQRLMKV